MKNLFDLKDKIALITGASSGIGKAIAEALGSHGATVIISSNDANGCKQTVIDFHAKEIEAYGIYCDVSLKVDIDNLIEKVIERRYSFSRFIFRNQYRII